MAVITIDTEVFRDHLPDADVDMMGEQGAPWFQDYVVNLRRVMVETGAAYRQERDSRQAAQQRAQTATAEQRNAEREKEALLKMNLALHDARSRMQVVRECAQAIVDATDLKNDAMLHLYVADLAQAMSRFLADDVDDEDDPAF